MIAVIFEVEPAPGMMQAYLDDAAGLRTNWTASTASFRSRASPR